MTLFDRDLIERALMTRLQEQAAERGICPRCGTETMQPLSQAEQLVFVSCSSCQLIVVLTDRSEPCNTVV